MAEIKSSAGYTSAANSDGPFIVHTPVWCTVVRGLQAFFGFVILVLAGLLIHGLALDAIVFGLVCGLFTIFIVTYTLVSEKAPNCQNAYNIWAHLSLDLFMAILWLSSMGANAALRATFKYDVNAECWDDGSAVNAGHCVVSRRDLDKRAAVANQAGLAQMSAIAGLSALEMLLFIATLVYNGHTFRMHWQEKKAHGHNGTVEMKGQGHQQPTLIQQSAPAYPTYTDQQQYASHVYQQQPVQAQQQPYDTTYYGQQQQYTQQVQDPYAPAVQQQQQPQAYAVGGYAQQTPSDQYNYQQQQQQTYSPHGTPAQQQQPYHPPA